MERGNLEEKLCFTTTGISEVEKEVIRNTFKKSRYALVDTLSARTSYLLCYRAMFTEKYIQAHKWNIPCISPLWVYRSLNARVIGQYTLKKYEGAVFTTTSITNDIFKNYFVQQGAVYLSQLTRSTDFVVRGDKQKETDKTRFAERNSIPVISTDSVFYDNLFLMGRSPPFDIREKDRQREVDYLFHGSTFYIEGRNYDVLFSLLKKKIIEHGGSRVEFLDRDVTHIIVIDDKGVAEETKAFIRREVCAVSEAENTSSMSAGTTAGPEVLRYQWILDCIDTKSLLVSDLYKLRPETLGCPEKTPFGEVVAYLRLDPEERVKTRNKIRSLGGKVSLSLGSSVTHYIIPTKEDIPPALSASVSGRYNLKICTVDWIDQSLYYVKRMREERFTLHKPQLFLQKKAVPPTLPIFPEDTSLLHPSKSLSVLAYKKEEVSTWHVQFTGLSETLRARAVEILKKRGATIVDSVEYNLKCTHLIVGVPSISIKFLSALSNGIWILSYGVVDDIRLNRDIKEEEYILRRESQKRTNILDALVDSVSLCRERRTRTGRPSFFGWKVKVISINIPKQKIFSQLIVNGGGRVVKDSETGKESEDKDYIVLSDAAEEGEEGRKKVSWSYIFYYLIGNVKSRGVE